MSHMREKQTVSLALSGGVDSSAAAAMLLDEGCRVMAVTMFVCPVSLKAEDGSFYVPGIDEIRKIVDECSRLDECPLDDASPLLSLVDAARVSRYLGIEHHIVDLRDQFRREIIDSFAGEYYAGRTPNPCVMCNPAIKFGLLMDKARELGADYFATGHYARINKNEKTGLFELLRGRDRSKDQVYALYRLNQAQLSSIKFPLGEMTKGEVRDYARKRDLPVFDKEESQEICFIPDDDYIRFLKENYPRNIKPGPIVHVNGEVMGQHKGLIYYTVGQRRRLGIAHPKPLYVVSIDYRKNALVVGYWEDLFRREAVAGNLSWIGGRPPEVRRVLAKIRYRHDESPAMIKFEEGKNESPPGSLELVFDEPQRAVTPGQSAVFYSYPDGEKVLGGGIIA